MSTALTTVGLRPKSVLIVEDNIAVQETLAEITAEAGFGAALAASRKQAVALSDRRAFDIALVDKRLVELDSTNKDGFAVMRHVAKKNEGTHLILLTGYGEYIDVVELKKDVGEFTPLQKARDISNQVEEIRDALFDGARKGPPEYKKGSASKIFCGRDVPSNWEVGAHGFLRPDINLLELMNFLDEFALTCRPLFERAEDNGLQGTSVEGVMAGLYWSRGVGEAVVILLARGDLPATVPRLETWPPELQTGEVMYQTRRKNLVGAIIKCAGVDHHAFTVARQ